jgi:cytochrome c biogenesis protein CcmG, thiol:disulfide interchange protein DsbE
MAMSTPLLPEPLPPPLPPPEIAPPNRWLFRLPLILFGALALLFLARLFAGDPARLPSALIGKPAPATELPALAGLQRGGVPLPGMSDAGFRDRVTVVNVFASWCGPCREEHPLLMQLASSAPFASGRAVLAGLNHKDEPENARRFLAVLGNPYGAVGTDRNGRASIEWGVYGVPETFVVNKAGVITYKHVGPLDLAGLAKVNAAILSAGP